MRARFEGSVQSRLGWGWGGDRPLKLFAIGALQLSVLAAKPVIVLVAPGRRQRTVLLDINWAFIM